MEELDLKELFFMFWNKKLEIILITLMFVAVGIGYSYFFVKPEYTSTTSLVLAQSSSSGQTGDGAISATDLTMNSKLVSTYSELIKRKAILGQVCENLNIPDSNIQELRGKIKVNSAKNTEIIEISVTNKDPNKAAAIANEIAKVFGEKIVEIYNISNVYLLDRAEANAVPSNINHMKDVVIFAFIGLVIAAVYVLIANMLDNTIKTEQDVEATTELLVLSSIPNYDVEIKSKRVR
ncbi:MAG TPA: Wzz/FepE/Etk N-terminal domain-containing protein [Clostridiaceae bacterium]|jgi:wzd|nr:Wzz/FepE/Etk N-terminal domain-containing protein [Clostridiaceae bacterium]